MNASVAMGRVPANARFGHFEFTHERASVFDVCGGVRHQVLLFEGPTPDPHSLSRRHVVESLFSLNTRSTSPSTTCQPRNKRCTRVIAHMLPRCG